MSQKEGYINFEEYSQVGEPQKAERAYAWSTAIGLQAEDGLTVFNSVTARHSLSKLRSVLAVPSFRVQRYNATMQSFCVT